MKKIVFISIFLFTFSIISHTQSVKAGSISGKILSSGGFTLRDIKVELKSYPETKVENYFFWEGKARIDNVYTNPNGEYEFNHLPEGDYYLNIEFPKITGKAYEYIKKPAMPIKLNPEQNIKDADYMLKQIRTIISGKVYKRNAVTPCANISLELSCIDKIYSLTTTNEKGEYIFVLEPKAGQWEITVKDENKIITSPLKLDLSKINIFENINIICEE